MSCSSSMHSSVIILFECSLYVASVNALLRTLLSWPPQLYSLQP